MAALPTQRLCSLTTLCIIDTLPEERFDRITRLACRALGVPIALVSLVDRERQWFKSKQGLEACETSRHISLCGHAILRKGPFVVPDGSRIGTLCLIVHQAREFSAGDVVTLADLAVMVDRELALLSRAATDELTNLSNRRGFATVAKQVLALCHRNQQPAVVVGVDLDNFKSINDDFGHEAGDHALRVFAKLLYSHVRDSDVVARLGGDEFSVLCSATTAAVKAWYKSLQFLC